MPDDEKVEKKTRAPLTGMALQTDIIKKIGAQLERVKDAETANNILEFLQRALRKKMMTGLAVMSSAGQVGLPMGANGATQAAKDEGDLW